ncbi:tyrosine-type recombinase/integrase [uncultured Ruminococcus sp.]|uniref:tyrosine-type recombinase/integrase n=1 Tax=uncultured Ruminococcus sp. TaxID=165186 RepID=UPI002636C4F3|nr:tyrosine-type recombinase/integrase [uncultured Ruminococcus sp.]
MASLITIGNGVSKKYKLTWDVNTTDSTRKRKSKTFPAGTLLSTVKQFKLKVEQEYALGELQIVENTKTVGDVVEVYLETYTKFISPSTLKGYKSIIYNHKDGKGILDYWGKTYLHKITIDAAQRYVNFLVDCGLAPKSVRSYINLMSVLFQLADELGYIRRGFNPFAKLRMPPKKSKPIEVFTESELRELIEKAEKEDNEMVLLILVLGGLCGLRRGEMAGLKYENISIDDLYPEMKITESVIKVDSVIYEKAPKTAAGVRSIPLGKKTVELLKKARENYEKRKSENPDWTDSGHVLYQEDSGLAMLPKVIGRRYKEFMQSTNIPYRNLHVLRHTFASLLAKNGAPPKDLQSLLGHSDSYTSIQIYTHSYKEVQRKNTMLLDQEIFEKGSEVG